VLESEEQPEHHVAEQNRRDLRRAVLFSVVPLLAVLVASLLVIVSSNP
jgi:hypothetical protein